MAGLALPTAAAVALTFTATGAAMATSNKAQTDTVSQNSTALDDARSQAVAQKALATARTNAAASAARSAARKTLAARALEVKRVALAQSWRLPIKSYALSSGFGWRWGALHAGEDFAIPNGTDLASMSTGTVTFAGQDSGYGNLVKLRYWDGTVSYYAHMSSISVTEGDDLEPGQIVGQSGNTGHSTGPHLHLEIHPDGGDAVNPLPWLADHKIDV